MIQLLLLCSVLDIVYATSPYVVDWSSQSYGPDGPWQAVTVAIGSNSQSVDLYPGATYISTVLEDSICYNNSLSSTCYAARAGTYNLTESSTAEYKDANSTTWSTYYWATEGGAIETIVGDTMNFGPSVPNASIEALSQTYMTYPNGKAYPVSVGTLALGAPYLHNVVNNMTLNLLAAYLYTDGGDNSTPSYSYGMHIGAVDPAISGSLVLGGYDKSRVLGDVTAQTVSLDSSTSGVMQISLQDIGLGVATGGSPFSFTSKSGLFQADAGSALSREAEVDPTKPYMYLPEATCDAITADLPVTFNASLGLYFWDTDAANYTNITSSATYLSFTFDKDGANNENITIKVPLSLLNLTLQEPLVDTNTTYFPCFYTTSTPVLGRAFLQAAFIGTNWYDGNNQGTWFMAQAPGPGYSTSDVTTIGASDSTISASTSSWEDSWDGYWHPLADSTSSTSNSTSNTTTNTSSSSGLSTGAKAGIGVGVSVAGLLLIAAIAWILLRRRRQQTANAARLAEMQSTPAQAVELPTKNLNLAPRELDSKTERPVEMMGSQEQRYELD